LSGVNYSYNVHRSSGRTSAVEPTLESPGGMTVEVTHVLYIGRVHGVGASIIKSLNKHFHTTAVPSGKEVPTAPASPYHVIIVDAASMRTPGERLVTELRQTFPLVPLVHIHPGPKNKVRSSADSILIAPVTPQKVIKAVKSLLVSHEDDLLTYGTYILNRSRRVLTVNGQETQLTPKQALLVEQFFQNPGVVISRLMLMERVWNTDYMGDTRTLDVHIRWIRELIEDDPSRPQLLKTVRGVGYRLALPESEPQLLLAAD
jgi:DNA-binding response OmpR family regulator